MLSVRNLRTDQNKEKEFGLLLQSQYGIIREMKPTKTRDYGKHFANQSQQIWQWQEIQSRI